MMKKLSLVSALLLSVVTSYADDTKTDYIPRIGGVLRTRWEISTEDGYNRFAVRNARAKLSGRIARQIDYFFQADLCNQGKMQFLDAWARVEVVNGLKIKAGQFRMPFGVDPFRGPGTYIFANRSFIGRDVDNMRAVGLQASYQVPKTPITLEAGIFSPGEITDHSEWTRQKNFASKASCKMGAFTLAGGYQSVAPDSVRINMADFAVTFNHVDFTAEAEYMYKHYVHNEFRTCHAYNVWADYGFPLNKGLFRRLAVQTRLDGTTAHSNGKRNAAGELIANQPYRNRITLGSSLTYIHKPVKCELQLNYEKYFYHHDYEVPRDRGDKIVAELIVVF